MRLLFPIDKFCNRIDISKAKLNGCKLQTRFEAGQEITRCANNGKNTEEKINGPESKL
jgi:hypothetical protein